MNSTPPHISDMPVAKIVGFDTELANIAPGVDDQGFHASRAILGQIEGVSAGAHSNWAQDSLRVFLPETGASAYIDLNHIEIAGPEFRSAWDFLGGFHSMLGLVRQATRKANTDRDEPIQVLANNSDGHSNSYGGHLSLLTNRTTFDQIFHQRIHYLLFLASAQVSSIILTGQGKAGAEDDREPAEYQISQRADFMHCLASHETTRNRPIVNCRDEPLGSDVFARLHCIFHDTTLCHTSILLRVGFMQLILGMIEAGRVPPELIFEEPLAALQDFNRDPDLLATAKLVGGTRVTAVEHQFLLLDCATAFVDSGGAEEIVPGARQLLDVWERILGALKTRDWSFLARHLDWVAKRSLLDRAAARRGLGFDSPQIKTLDHMWSALDGGLYWALDRTGDIEHRVSETRIARAAEHPPDNTRAYARAHLLRTFADDITYCDWDEIILNFGGHRWRVTMPDPLSDNRDRLGDLEIIAPESLLRLLGATKTMWPAVRFAPIAPVLTKIKIPSPQIPDEKPITTN